VWQGVKHAAHPMAQPLCRAKILRTIPPQPTIVPIQSETSLHPNINGQQDRHGVYLPQRNQGRLDIEHVGVL